jgi:Na+/H+ antiporter NhaD/arsenite permease-like protein
MHCFQVALPGVPLLRRSRLRRLGVACVLVGLLAGFLLTTSIAWVTLAAAGLLALAEALLTPPERDASDILRHVDGPLLIMISGFTRRT